MKENNLGLKLLSAVLLIIALGIIAFCLYIIPHAFMGLNYEIPDFFLNIIGNLEKIYNIKGYQAYLLVLLGFVIIAVILFIITALIEAKIQRNIIEKAKHTPVSTFVKMAAEDTRKFQVTPQLAKSHIMVKYLAAILIMLLILEALEYLLTIRFDGIF